MNKYIITVITDFARREYGALASDLSELHEVAETLGYIMVEETVPYDYIMQKEGYDDWNEDLLAEVLANTNMSEFFRAYGEPFVGTDEEFNKYELVYSEQA